jgi:hypothetical protein
MALCETVIAAVLCEPCRADASVQVWDEATGAIRAAYCPHQAVMVYRYRGGVMVFEHVPVAWRVVVAMTDAAMQAMASGGLPSA